MFDPSKLDLDLDNIENNNSKKEENKKEKQQNNDILENLDTSITEQLQNDSVLEDFNNPILEEISTSEKNEKEEKIQKTNIVEKELKEENKKEIGRTAYEQSIIDKKEIEEKNRKKQEKDEKPKIVFDINIVNIDILLDILIDKEYDFATFEPMDIDSAVKITFRKDKIIKEVRYIKYPTFTDILIKAKALTNLTIDETEQTQEGSGEKIIRQKNYKIITKVVPSDLGAKLFIKTVPLKKKIEKKEVKKISMGQIMTFLSAILFIALIIGGGFIGFIVLNAKTIEDVKFFYSLGINLNQINAFIGQAIAIIFSILLFIETIFLIIFLFKFSLTKKEFKQKKIRLGIISTIVLILTFSTASAWMIIDKKIKALPNWQEMAYGDIQIFDNSKLLSDSFDKQSALLEDTSNLIGPVEIKFDLSFYAKKEKQKGFTIKKYIWDFGDGIIEEKTEPIAIHKFNKKGNHKIKLTLEEVDLQGKVIEKEMDKIPDINISYTVNINEKKLNNGGKLIELDASDLKQLGKIEWYFTDNLDKPVWVGNIFRPGKPIFEETLIGMYIKRKDKTSEKLDKVFIIKGQDKVNLSGEIKYTRGILDDLSYEFKLSNIQNDFGNGYIEEYKWKIGTKEITKEGDITNPEKASTIKYKFKEYGEHTIKVTIKDSAGETKTISKTIKVTKNLRLSRGLRIFNDGNLLRDIEYNSKLNEYYINDIGTPTTIKLDTRFVKAEDLNYRLDKVDWDFNSDGDIDESGKTVSYDLNTEGGYKITVLYKFINKKIDTDIINLKEQIFIEGMTKEAVIDFKIIKKNNYVPVIVGFDASTSTVKNGNIEKFIWDYGDGITEERDSIVQGHKYTNPGNYTIKVKIITSNGKEYSKSKRLILKPKPQSIKIVPSMKKAPIGQGIDFSSEESEGQITGYFWNFGDGEISTDANPTHMYKKAGKYKVSLELDFANKNRLQDNINIEIVK